MFSPRVTWILAGSAIVALLFGILTMARSPLPDVDEVYIASAAMSLAKHGPGVPTVLPDGLWNIPFLHAYGPVFFVPAAAAIRVFGVSATAVRSVCLTGAMALAVAAGWLSWRAGSSRSWAVCVASIVWLAPEIGRAATNGRMDTVAVALEIAAMSMLVTRHPFSSRDAVVNGLIGGLFTGFALMTTPRAILWAAGLAGAAIATAWYQRRGREVLIWILVCALTAMLCVSVWTMAIGSGPVSYATALVAGASRDTFNSATTGARAWSFHFVAIAALAGMLAVVVALIVSRGTVVSDTAPAMIALWGWVVTAAAAYVLRVNHTFFREIYFVTPVTIVALATAGTFQVSADGRRTLVAGCAATALLFMAVRVVKSGQIIESWRGRDPAPLEAFFKANLPNGTDVFGLNQYYFYAVERTGAHFKALDAEPYGEPFPGSPTIGRPPESVLPELRERVRGHLLIWPTGAPFHPAFRCAQAHPVAKWIPADDAVLLNRLPVFKTFADRLTYPATTIYQMPSNCPS